MALHFRRPRPLIGLAAVLSAAIIAGVTALTASASGLGKVDTARLGRPKSILVYDKGRPTVERPVVRDSEEELAIISWMQSHEKGWRPSIISYAPAKKIVGDNFDLNFMSKLCVLNYRVNEDGPWRQVTRFIEDSEKIPGVFK